MLKLKNISKQYSTETYIVDALKNINLEFRESEFVSILGPSGSGKTTMLNIIGGLDRYTQGDLLINGKSTQYFKNSDWDSYRNGTVGFVFQNYNLIPHLNVLGNVEIALTLSGVSITERKKRAYEALKSVGLDDQLNKKPNQLSGGQMQRVAIARALVNNPKIILADEPTGALDSRTSEQIMEILKEISKDRLIIMVTHNNELADKYSSRIIKLMDGEVQSDSMPYQSDIEPVAPAKFINPKKSSMSFFTALKLSFNNLKTKKVRTIITSIAASIGIIGVGLVMAISSGTRSYIIRMQSDTLANFPIVITQSVLVEKADNSKYLKYRFTDENVVIPFDNKADNVYHTNIFSEEFIEYLDNMDPAINNSVSYIYGVNMNLVTKTDEDKYKRVNPVNATFQQLPPNDSFVSGLYDILAGTYPKDSGEALLILDSENRVHVNLLKELGISYDLNKNFTFEDFLGYQLKVVFNDAAYAYDEEKNTFSVRTDYENMYNSEDTKTVTISGIIRIKETASSGILNRGIGYTQALTEEFLENAQNSQAVLYLKENPDRNPLNGAALSEENYNAMMVSLGGDKTPQAVLIYPKTFASKDLIKDYLNEYNIGKEERDTIRFTDSTENVIESISTLIDTISFVLTAFAAISLVVSSIMIGIITYISVVERTKEIGILRSIGARKIDISRVFNAETVIIGFSAGVLGVVFTLLLSIPFNLIIQKVVNVSGIAKLPVATAFILIGASMLLTLIAGIIPSKIAAKKDPVEALRTE